MSYKILAVIAVFSTVTTIQADTVTIDGRRVLVNLPASYNSQAKSALVIALHGFGSKPEHMFDDTGLKQKSDQHGFVLAAPSGLSNLLGMRAWNAGNCCTGPIEDRRRDVTFVEELITELQSKYPKIDPARMYLVGMSNGGMLAHRVGIQINPGVAKIAGIASVAGTLAISDKEIPRGVASVPVIHFHGTRDVVVSPSGSRGGPLDIGGYRSVDDALVVWQSVNKTNRRTASQPLPDAARDRTTVERFVYSPSPGANGAKVHFIEINGGGHTWPGHDPPAGLPVGIKQRLGRVCRDIKAEDLIVKFFGL